MLDYTSRSNLAFTLAEILIVIAIIGVIAAITIPPLVNNIQEMQYRIAAKESYSKAAQAVQLMKKDNGGSIKSYYTDGTDMRALFKSYFKVLKDCIVDSCSVPSYNTLSGRLATVGYGGNPFLTTDGMYYTFFTSYTGFDYISFITVDINGPKPPNVYGRDFFMFEIIEDERFVPMGSKDSWITFPANYCDRNPAGLGANSSFQGLGCMQFVVNGTDY